MPRATPDRESAGPQDHGHPDATHRGEHQHHHQPDHEHRGRSFVSTLLHLTKHSHGPDVTTASIDTSREGIRALEISLAGLALTAIIQIIVVFASGSVALLSESIHNFADALTALPLGVAFLIGRKKANTRYTYGYGRAEDLAGIIIVLIIASSTGLVLAESVVRLIHPRTIEQIPFVIVAGLVGFVGNEGVAIYRIRIGKRIGSAALTADGLHARSDGLASLAVVAGAIGAGLGLRIADPIASLVVGVAIIGILREAASDIYHRLMDSVDPRLVQKVHDVLVETPGIEGVEEVHLRWIGHNLRAEADVLSDSGLSLVESHLISEEAHHRLLHQIPRLSEAVIHTSPKFKSGDSAHQRIAHHFPEETDPG